MFDYSLSSIVYRLFLPFPDEQSTKCSIIPTIVLTQKPYIRKELLIKNGRMSVTIQTVDVDSLLAFVDLPMVFGYREREN